MTSFNSSNLNIPYVVRCMLCNTLNDENETSTYCTSCGGVLRVEYERMGNEIQYPVKELPEDPLRTRPTELKYLSKLSEKFGVQIYGKCEFQHPTGCFKDRGSYIEVLKAIELNRKAICLASTGNMAASVAAYACYFNLPCYVFVPEGTTEGKLAQAMIYNAKVIKVKGDYSKCEALCRTFAESDNYYLAGDYVFREEGQKSMSFEVIDQQSEPFDFVLVPVGCGTNFGAIWKGFKEAREMGKTSHLPRMVAIQPLQSSPVIDGLIKKEKVVADRVNTMAGAVAAADPVDFHKVFEGINESDGLAFTITEEEILRSLRDMAQMEGIFTEPACALPLAAIKKYPKHFEGKRCCLVLTGTGLKDTGVVVRHSLPSPVLNNNLSSIQKFIRSGYLEIQAEAFGKWHGSPFGNLKLEPDQAKIMERYRSQFSKKGKVLTEKEVEVLQSMVFDEVDESNSPAEIIDYDLRMKKNGLVTANVTLRFEGKKTETKAKGLGPLHAVLTAVKSVTDSRYPLEITDHNVEVLSPAANSLVVVTLHLSRGQQQFMTKSVSTDTIEAGLKAYTKGLALAFQENKNPS